MAHSKRSRTEHKKQRTKHLREMKKKTAVAKFRRKREKWILDKDYQKKQTTRMEILKKHAGYEKNLVSGIENKQNAKNSRKKKHLARERLRKAGRMV